MSQSPGQLSTGSDGISRRPSRGSTTMYGATAVPVRAASPSMYPPSPSGSARDWGTPRLPGSGTPNGSFRGPVPAPTVYIPADLPDSGTASSTADHASYVESLRFLEEQALATPPPKQQSKPIAAVIVLILCLGAFGFELWYNWKLTGSILAPIDVNPLFGPAADTLIKCGAKVTCLIQPPFNEWWRLVSPLILHAGVIHIATNMLMLFNLGFQLERNAGTAKFILIYLLAGIMSMAVSALMTDYLVTVGASGALFGILGAFVAELCTNCHLVTFKEGMVGGLQLFFSIAINLTIGCEFGACCAEHPRAGATENSPPPPSPSSNPVCGQFRAHWRARRRHADGVRPPAPQGRGREEKRAANRVQRVFLHSILGHLDWGDCGGVL